MMGHSDKWIWLPESRWPDSQICGHSAMAHGIDGSYTVAEFKREYAFDQTVRFAAIRVSGDTLFRLYLNGKMIVSGPPAVGGDFIGNETVRDNYYAYEVEISPYSKTLSFIAEVQMTPTQICDYSKGHGGFMLDGTVTLEDGRIERIFSDGSWICGKLAGYTAPGSYDGRIEQEEYAAAQVTEDIWHVETAPIPARTENELFADGCVIASAPGETKQTKLELDKIYAGFVHVKAECEGEVKVKVLCRELGRGGSSEEAVFDRDGDYRGFILRSAGNLLVDTENRSDKPAKLTVSFIETHYPVEETAQIKLSDSELNDVIDTCRHTLMICRQTHHLDSPSHCEPMACTGDYYIESLMTMFSFGDMRLAEFDLIRTAYMLERENGRMFHTTYSCIWARMLYDIYMAAGNVELLKRCVKALGLLLSRFDGYIGENGLIETPPDYMFVDWIYIDGISMHHPPKALGQSCLNMFYYGALEAAEKIYGELALSENAAECGKKKEALRKAINTHLFDSEKRCFFMGLNTPTDEKLIGGWMPENVGKRYYLKHANILAAYFGICDDDTARDIVDRIMSDDIVGECQPYFLHYLLEAIYRLGLREKYTLAVINRWKEPVKECPKGLAEGFVKPEPTYSFDHSHAWGGTPLYSLPKAITGLEIIKPGMKEIKLSPSLLGLEYAAVEIPTPNGTVRCELSSGKAPSVTYPERITVDLSE